MATWAFGFSLIELILVVAVVLLIGLISVLMYSNFYLRNAALNAMGILAFDFRKAQLLSMEGKSGGSWGVTITGGDIVFFQGTSYAARDTSFDETYTLPSSLTVNGMNETVFARMTGIPNITSTVTFSGGGVTHTLFLQPQGTVNQF